MQAKTADLDRLLGDEPSPLAPPEFAQAVVTAVADLRRRELRAARTQVLVALAAAVLLAALGTWFDSASPLADPDAAAWIPDGEAAWSQGVAAWTSLAASLEAGAAQVLDLPSPPLLLLLLLAPVIVAVNWSLARDRLPGRTT